MRIRLPLIAAVLVAAAAGSASAHHSYAAFDRSKKITLSGTVKAWDWTNPHTWLTVTVADPKKKGAMQDWAFEGAAPASLRPRGWSRTILKAGDKVTVTFSPRRDGSNGGNLLTVIGADGKPVGGTYSPGDTGRAAEGG
jgi:hypothetical protein